MKNFLLGVLALFLFEVGVFVILDLRSLHQELYLVEQALGALAGESKQGLELR